MSKKKIEEPKVVKEEPKVAKEEPKVVKEEPKVAKEEPKVAKEEPKVVKEEPKVAKEEPKVAKEEPKVEKKKSKDKEIDGRKIGTTTINSTNPKEINGRNYTEIHTIDGLTFILNEKDFNLQVSK